MGNDPRGPEQNGSSVTTEPLIFATYLAPSLYPVYKFILDYTGDELGIKTEIVVGKNYKQIVRGESDVCFVCGLPYVLLTRHQDIPIEPIAAPVLKGERYQDKPIYFSDVITQKETPWNSFDDLRGRSWAYNEPKSQSGYGITLYKLLTMGETKGFFGTVIETGFHQKSIESVAEGTIDASAIDSQVLAVEFRENPELSNHLKIIDTLGPSTIQPAAVNTRMSESLKSDLQSVLFKLGDTPRARQVLDFGMIDRFFPVNSSSYDDIRAMRTACKSAGFTKLV